ncbi:MAG TPA: cytidylate kinase family protein [Thermodesulfobacteriota bacterium]|nr:cytidylate kinase family protein [Thermodesulfobacteriota bacterium]
MSIITVSKQLGSLGTEIAQALAVRLNSEYVDKEKIGGALMDCGLEKIEIEKLDEKNPSFWESWSIDRKRFIHYLQRVIYDFAQKNDVVIVGRGGQVLLKDIPGVLKVRVTAPLEVRIRRIMERDRIDEKQALHCLKRNDQDSAGFIRSSFNVDWDDAALYDLVINTHQISIHTAVNLILNFLQSPEIKEDEEKGRAKLKDLALFQKVDSALMHTVGMSSVDFRVDEGVVTLEGTVISNESKKNCERAVANIEGVTQVRNQLSVSMYYPYST